SVPGMPEMEVWLLPQRYGRVKAKMTGGYPAGGWRSVPVPVRWIGSRSLWGEREPIHRMGTRLALVGILPTSTLPRPPPSTWFAPSGSAPVAELLEHVIQRSHNESIEAAGAGRGPHRGEAVNRHDVARRRQGAHAGLPREGVVAGGVVQATRAPRPSCSPCSP